MSAVALHHVWDGPPGAPVLVLGPSLGTDLGLFAPQAAALSDVYRVLRVDLRGHGGSPPGPGPAQVADLAADVLALLEDQGVDGFAYAGVSLGGAVGLQLALTVPARLRALVVIASAARFPDPPSWAARAARVRAEGTGFLLPSRTGAWFTADFAHRHPDEARRLLAMLAATPAEGYAAACEALGGFDVRHRLGEITAPTLVVAGGDDPATPPATVRAIAAGVPGAEYLCVPGTAHLVSAERPDVVSDAVRDHLGRHHRP